MYSRGDLRLIDGLASQATSCCVIDASTHHGTGQFGEVGAPYDDGERRLALSSAPPKGEDVAWLDRFVKGSAERNRAQAARALHGPRRPHVARRAVLGFGDPWPDIGVSCRRRKSGTAAASPNDGTLASGVPTGRDSYQDSYVYTPTSGASVPSGKEGPDAFAPYVPLDQTIDQPSGLTFTGAPLSQPLRLAGPSELRFWAVTEASDMAWVARLIDVAPNGSQQIITQGWLRASFRHVDPARSRDGSPYLTDDQDTPVGIGEDTEYRMDIWDSSYTLQPGHRLRLWFSSSDSPNHTPLPVAGRNLIFHDATHPSQLLLGTRSDSASIPSPWAGAAISRLRVSPSVFPAARAGASIARRRSRKTGTTVSYVDSLAAVSTFTVRRPVAGVKSKRRGCVAARRGQRVQRAQRCTRWVAVGSFTHRDRAGANHFHFTGRLRRRGLRPGRYRLDAVPRLGGARGRLRSAMFRIVR